MQLACMEDDDNNNSSNQFNRIVQQLLRTNMSRERRELFWYDIRNFPDSLLMEILSRLPVKSIFRFKSVCKHWQILISDPSFCRFYYSILNSNSALSRPFRFLHRYTYVPNFKEFLNRLVTEIHSSSELSVLFLSTPEEQHRYDQFRVLAMSNGLILCCLWSPTFIYYICDPLTGQWITLPSRRRGIIGFTSDGFITRVNEDHTLIGYTIVTVELQSRSNYVNIEMFSSETDKWIVYKLPCPIPIRLRELDGPSIYCYGGIHWPIRCDEGTHRLLAFDPYKDPKSVRLIPLPDDADLRSERLHFQLCGESQGTLRYFEVADDSTQLYLFTMWSIKDYEKGEWCCEFKVRRSDLHSNDIQLSKWLFWYGWFLPLSFHPLNPNVVYLSCMEPERIVSYNVLNRRLDVSSKPFDFSQFIYSSTTIPFVLPKWPVLVPMSTVRSNEKRVKCRK